ncbi:hypothetical protein W911_07865 [Hyphomicrobium nitrativorans NL23]|uniref:Uncharacterized protein n=1 Tax=Hyphomicrobium nitrativorans NL23 TaxID=1029756 RepID=V5SGT9_9HYPH|nr:hypothetical protein [Hyphomicrobium nitrativorans]AHB50091.1 hypothetical protein W911_07865 [Hyphomicrobium nitrativorans NL23]
MAGGRRWGDAAVAFALGLVVTIGLWGGLAVAAEDAPRAPGDGPWRMILQDQLKKEKGCDLKEVLSYQEIPLGDEIMIEGRVSCIDDRAFDFTRSRKHQKFRIELCEPVVC